MSFDLENMKAFFSKLTLEQIYNGVVVFIILLTIALATFALYRPISVPQFHQTLQLSQQYNLPQTQNMAEFLLSQQSVSRGQYLKLMQAYQQESNRAKQLPPLEEEAH